MKKLAFIFVAIFVLAGQNFAQKRPIDGYGNNLNYPEWGAVNAQLLRLANPDYADGISQPKLDFNFGRKNPREISNDLFDQQIDIIDPLNLSDFVWAFGQFIDHDITLVPDGNELLDNIIVPEGDKYFEENSILYMRRSQSFPGTGTSLDNPREHVNAITAFIDGSTIYGSDEERASYLRTYEDGKLKVSENNMLPWNTLDGSFNKSVDHNAPHMEDPTGQMKKFFVAGDTRANENPLLIVFHTLFVREHNRMCDEVKIKHPSWNDERIYQEARNWVIGFIQNITFNEWLPAMGINLPTYTGYNEDLNPGVFNEFSAAAFRIGHTLINTQLLRLDSKGNDIPQGHISLKDAFFNPLSIVYVGGMEPYLQGMATHTQQDMDTKVINDVRNFLFGAPEDGGLDLVSININRGRERGLPSFNEIREAVGKPSIKTYLALTGDEERAEQLEEIYGLNNIASLDPWVGMLAEKKENDALMGELMMHIIRLQFRNLRDGDRFYFERDGLFNDEEIEAIKNTTMRDIIMRNSSISLMQKEVFRAMPTEMISDGPELFPVNLEAAVYPNPIEASFRLKVKSSSETELNIQILDFEGKKITDEFYHAYEGDNIIDFTGMDNLSSGYYNLLIISGENYNVLKLVKK